MYHERRLKKQVENERRKKRLIVYTLFLLTVIYLSSTLVFTDMGLLKYLHLNRNRQKLVQEIAALDQENAVIENEIKTFQSNIFYLEKHAREDLNLSRPDELIFIYEK